MYDALRNLVPKDRNEMKKAQHEIQAKDNI
jgi:hypothetical protein